MEGFPIFLGKLYPTVHIDGSGVVAQLAGYSELF
jgi:hypothetical protein